MNINFNLLIKNIIPLFIIVLVAYGIDTLLYFYLPNSQNISVKEKNYNFEYNKYQVTYSLKEKVVVPKPIKKVENIKKEYQLISSIILKAIYATSENKGWIIIAEKANAKTHILSIGEDFNNYTLKDVYNTYVIFEKNSKEYKLSLNEADTKTNFTTVTVEEKVDDFSDSIEQIDNNFNIKRNLINDYIKTPSNIWKNISIIDVKNNGAIDGFRVTRIAKDSVFEKLGLQVNDIIKSVNNVKLDSYMGAFKIYKKINQLTNLNFVILRGDTEMEIDYEIQ